MTNFDFLKADKRFDSFADAAIAAEYLLHIDVDSCVSSCRRSMEFAVKWMYSVDRALTASYHDTLVSLMNKERFRTMIGADMWRRLDFIRKLGNVVMHEGKKVTQDQAELCLENLFCFLDQVAYFYSGKYTAHRFDRNLLELTAEEALSFVSEKGADMSSIIEENRTMKAELTARREEQEKTYSQKPLELSEDNTRKIYIDFMLGESGWIKGRDRLDDVALSDDADGPVADHVLLDSDGSALAVIDTKLTSADEAEGRRRAKYCADILEKRNGRRPVIFLSNGFDTRIIDGYYPERKVASVFSKRDLEKLLEIIPSRESLEKAKIGGRIAGRYYQKEAIRAVCDAFDGKNERKALLAMASGSGKTRTVIGICDVLFEQGWVENVLFLAERASLVTQAERCFTDLLAEIPTANLCEEKGRISARCVFSTYDTMMNVIDRMKDEGGKLFTPGHFDLVICDEAHSSVINRYRDVLNYFDALLVGTTSTPKEDIKKEIYDFFELAEGAPTYAYELETAVKDGYLVDFKSVDTRLRFVGGGVSYDEMTDEGREMFESTFGEESDLLPESDSDLSEWIFNVDTIREVLRIVMEDGLKIDRGTKLGKTVIFAKNRAHAEKILDVFEREYPDLPGFTAIIDNRADDVQKLIDDFSCPDRLPEIAVSVDLLDTGIDVPEILNLVFFKRVMSKSRFRQMIGRGARLCKNLLDGKDKEKFYIFDFCGNFEFFRIATDTGARDASEDLRKAFLLKAKIAAKLASPEFRTYDLIEYRNSLVNGMVRTVKKLNRENFAVRQHLKYIDRFSSPEGYRSLTSEDIREIESELLPLIRTGEEDADALRFDVMLYETELSFLSGEKPPRCFDGVIAAVRRISEAGGDEIGTQRDLIDRVLDPGCAYGEKIGDLEYIRENLRGLNKYAVSKTI